MNTSYKLAKEDATFFDQGSRLVFLAQHFRRGGVRFHHDCSGFVVLTEPAGECVGGLFFVKRGSKVVGNRGAGECVGSIFFFKHGRRVAGHGVKDHGRVFVASAAH